jgi:hypothetical protein
MSFLTPPTLQILALSEFTNADADKQYSNSTIGRFPEHAQALNPTAQKHRLFGKLADRLSERPFRGRFHASLRAELAGTVMRWCHLAFRFKADT